MSKFNIRLSSEHLALEESGFPDGVNCPIRVRRFLFFISNNVLHASIRGTIFFESSIRGTRTHYKEKSGGC